MKASRVESKLDRAIQRQKRRDSSQSLERALEREAREEVERAMLNRFTSRPRELEAR